MLPPAEAVIFIHTADINHNTTAPTGELAESGWQFQGLWGNFLGTAIAPNHFITAKHVGGSVGNTFLYHGDGESYTTIASYNSPDSDLTVWEVDRPFVSFAPLFTGDPTGEALIVFGRGTERGPEVYNVHSELAGWQYGFSDGITRWGQNTVSGTLDLGSGFGEMLEVKFDNPGVANEATLAPGDSGGGVFVEDDGIWKLAGINYGVEGPFSADGESAFGAALFDKGGLYQRMNGGWNFVPDASQNLPTLFVATSISSNSDWILSTVPEPVESGILFGLSLMGFISLRRFTRCPTGRFKRFETDLA